MRHSRRLSNHSSQPQGPFCSHCAVNLATFPAYVRCADPECKNIPICVDCFSVGAADKVPHKPKHPYRIIEKLTEPIYVSDWAAHEELRLLEALSEHGPHHWKAVADYVGKTQRKCEVHYENVYLKGPNAPLPTSTLGESPPASSPAVSVDGMEEADGVECKPDAETGERKPGANGDQSSGDKRKLKNKDSEPGSGTLDGFMPLRGDFDVEWDDKAEQLVSDLAIDHTDTPEEIELKTRLLFMYNERLQRRNAVKDFLFDRKLLDFANLKYNDRRGTRDEKELAARLQVFSRFLPNPEFQAFYNSVMTQYRISRDVYRIAQGRKAGMRTKAEVDLYEVERKARAQRLGEQGKGAEKNGGIAKRRRSSVGADSPAAPSTPLNSVPGTPGSSIVSPSKTTSPTDNVTGNAQSVPTSAQVRKARERKRIARSPYPVLEAMPVDDMEDAWKLSQTEKKLCSALHIPPAEFLRLRDAMLYTATQNVKRRDRPKKRGSGTPVLTIRARRQGSSNEKDNQKQSAHKTQEPSVVLNTVPLSIPRQQLTLRQTNSTPPDGPIRRATLTDKPLAANDDNESDKKGGEFANDKLQLSMKLAPPEIAELPIPMPETTARTVSSTRGLDRDDLPLSATFSVPSEHVKEQQGSSQAEKMQDNTRQDAREHERHCTRKETPKSVENDRPTSAENGPTGNAPISTTKDVQEGIPRDSLTNPAKGASIDTTKNELKDTCEDMRDDTLECTREGTPESEISCDEDVVYVTAMDQARPMTRAFAKLSKQKQENVKTHLTTVSRTNSPLEGPRQADVSLRPKRTVLRVTTLKIERPVTRSYAARMQPTVENTGGHLDTPTGKSLEVSEREDVDLGGELRSDAAQVNSVRENHISMEIATLAGSSAAGSVEDKRAGDVDDEKKLPKLRQDPNCFANTAPDDDASSRDEVDEVLCGEDGAEDWSSDMREPGQHVETTLPSLREGKPREIVPTGVVNEETRHQLRTASDADELLDQGRASVDSTPARTPRRVAKKEPNTPCRSSRRLTRKQPSTPIRTPQRLAKKQPRHLAKTETSAKGKQRDSPKQRSMNSGSGGEGKETEVTSDGEGDGKRRKRGRSPDHKTERSDDADSVEILSGGDGECSESMGKVADEVEEVTLDEGQDDVVEDVRDSTWTPQDSDDGDDRDDQNDVDDQRDAASIEDRTCQTELATEPGSPNTSLQDGEFKQLVRSGENVNDHRKTRGVSRVPEGLAVVRKSRRVQKRSRRLEESVEAATRSVKRRRTNPEGNRAGVARKTPANITGTPASKCTVITGQIGSASIESIEQTEAEGATLSRRPAQDTPHSRRKSSRQSTPSRPRYLTTERRITRSAGRQTRSRSASLRNRSHTDRISFR